MNKPILEDLLGQRSKITILRILSKESELTGREIARKADLSPRAAQQALLRLHAQGLLNRKGKGSSHLFSINEKNYIVKTMLSPLFEGEKRILDAILEQLRKLLPTKNVLSMAIFGSAAGGESRYGSDLDLFILLKDSRQAHKAEEIILQKNQGFSEMFGIPVSPYVIGLKDFATRFDKKDKLIRNVVKKGIPVWGKSLAEALADESKKTSR
ncbi:MAG: nucleotidyltransferase domain-containing protein [Elusimicrobia bacterium]|nr:nucleotidyltransferase domain-containing protein [Elusimicrobiota bacterium]